MDKYSNKYLNNFNELSNAVIGFEWEFYCERSYYKLLELLNRELDPVKVYGYRIYHSSGEVSKNRWKIESDHSLGPAGIELISEPLDYINAKVYLLKVLKLLQSSDFRTDDRCSLHINISFNNDKTNKTIDKLNKLKTILDMDEEMVYKYFPNRKNNFYCKSIKKIIPFKNFDFSKNAIEILTQSLELPDTKYYGINFLNIYDTRLEFRYIGGKDYQFKTAEILELMDYFILLAWNCIDEKLTDDDIDKLVNYLSDNINQFKTFSKLDNFIAEFPSILLQVDKSNDLIILKTYFEQLYDQLYDIITNTYNLNNCIINYDTQTQKLEIVDATFKTIFDIKNIEIIDSVIDGGSFSNCSFLNCEIKNAHFTKCKIIYTVIEKSKIEYCKIEDGSILNNCYVYNSQLDGKMVGGVFRSGKLGESGELDSDVKIVTPDNNYFNTNQEDHEKTDTLDFTKKDIKITTKTKKTF